LTIINIRMAKMPVSAGFGRQYRLPPWSVQMQQDNAHPYTTGISHLNIRKQCLARRVKGSFGFEKRYEGSGFAEKHKGSDFLNSRLLTTGSLRRKKR
jgi:hypothetical protein